MKLSLAVLALLSLPIGSAGGQASSTDIITGQITADDGRPVALALVEAMSLETQIVRSVRTNAQGRYTILFPDGGGQYQITIRAIGMLPVQRVIARQVDEDRLVFNVRLSSTPTRLDPIVVSTRRAPPLDVERPTAGTTERALTPDQVARLPIDPTDLALLATLAPGVVAIPGTDSTAAGFSVAGQRPGDNNVTLDGLSFGATTVPQDALRVTRVVTNTYDASRGQFSGGLVASTTRSGSNLTQGTGNYSFRDRSLVLTSEGDNPFASGFTQHQGSFGLGGPVVRNQLFVFASAQGSFRGDDLQSLLNAPAASLERLGASPDSVGRFLGLLGGFGLPATLSGEADRDARSLSTLARIDWSVSDAHTVAFRGDYRTDRQQPTRVSPLSVPSTGGTQSSHGGGGMLTVNSRFGTSLINELRAYLSGSSRRASAAEAFPAGRVQVASLLEDGASGVTTFAFGGNPGLPQRSSSTAFEATNELSWLPGAGAHRLKLGAFLSLASDESDGTTNRYGTFTFNSLADLEAGRPASFTRTLASVIRSSASKSGALYLTDQWRVSDALQLSLGMRAEGSAFGDPPPANAAVAQRFGLRTDRLPSEVHVSPRLGFTWVVGGLDPEAPPRWFVRGGLGEFRSRMPAALVSSVFAATGVGETESQLVCIGPLAPTPDWSGYLADPNAIPTACVGGPPGPSPLPTRRAAVTAFAEDFGAPRAWRGSLGITRRMGLHALSAELSYARGRSQFGFTDVNLGAPWFALVEEGGRPVFAPAATIDPGTGGASLFGSRLDPSFGQVLRIDSDLESESTQLTLSATGTTRRALIYSVSYTWSRSRDQSSFSGGAARGGFGAPTTAGDPNAREWATSDFQRRHSFLATVTYPVTNNIEVTSITRFTSGTPYTPRVSGDINADGAANDRAFVFSAAAADPAVASGMARLLAGSGGRVRACLERQLGQVAGRNSCSGPWQPSLDLQLNYRPTFLGLNQRLLLSVTTVNLLAGVDELLHGRDGVRGWGQGTRPDPILLSVEGFDPVGQRFQYAVNERFGATTASANAIRSPFQLGLNLRYSIGPDRAREFLRGLRAGFPAGGPGGPRPGDGRPGAGRGPVGFPGGAAPAEFLARLDSVLPNPARDIIAIRIALRLADSQVASLTGIADSMAARVRAVGDSARGEVERAGPNADPARLMLSLQPLLRELREAQRSALESAEGVLTPEQWAQVPERIKNAGGLGRAARRPPP